MTVVLPMNRDRRGLSGGRHRWGGELCLGLTSRLKLGKSRDAGQERGLTWAKICEVSFPKRAERTMIYRTICFEI